MGGGGLGKKFQLNTEYPNVSFHASTVNRLLLKTVNLDCEFWYNGNKKDAERFINQSFRQAKLSILKSFHSFSKEKMISIIHMPKELKDRFFVRFEFTLFLEGEKPDMDDLTLELINGSDIIYKEIFKDSIFFQKKR